MLRSLVFFCSCSSCLLVLYLVVFYVSGDHRYLHVLTHSFPTRRSSDLSADSWLLQIELDRVGGKRRRRFITIKGSHKDAKKELTRLLTAADRSEEHTSDSSH